MERMKLYEHILALVMAAAMIASCGGPLSYEVQIKIHEGAMCDYQHKIVMHSLRDTLQITEPDGTVLGESVEASFFWDKGWDMTTDDLGRMRRGVYYFQDGELVTSHSGWSSDSTLREKAIQELRERKGSI